MYNNDLSDIPVLKTVKRIVTTDASGHGTFTVNNTWTVVSVMPDNVTWESGLWFKASPTTTSGTWQLQECNYPSRNVNINVFYYE